MAKRTDNLQDQLIRDEGVRHSAYQDSLGYWTIGVGRMIDARRGGGIDDREVRYLLHNDIDNVRSQVSHQMPWSADLDLVRLAVLHNMAFQMGIAGLAGFSNTLRMVRNGDYDQAALGMLESKWANQTPNRARRLAEQMRTGEWV